MKFKVYAWSWSSDWQTTIIYNEHWSNESWVPSLDLVSSLVTDSNSPAFGLACKRCHCKSTRLYSNESKSTLKKVPREQHPWTTHPVPINAKPSHTMTGSGHFPLNISLCCISYFTRPRLPILLNQNFPRRTLNPSPIWSINKCPWNSYEVVTIITSHFIYSSALGLLLHPCLTSHNSSSPLPTQAWTTPLTPAVLSPQFPRLCSIHTQPYFHPLCNRNHALSLAKQTRNRRRHTILGPAWSSAQKQFCVQVRVMSFGHVVSLVSNL